MISISRSGIGLGVGSGRVEMVMGKGVNAAGDSRHDGTFKFLQELCIPLCPSSLDGLSVPC